MKKPPQPKGKPKNFLQLVDTFARSQAQKNRKKK